MKLVIYPAVEETRLERIRAARLPELEIVNAASEPQAVEAMPGADALFGKLTPAMLAASTRLRWVQTATASLEHYIFPELVAHDLVLTNMRGLYGDVVADQALGYIICFARNLHRYIRQQTARVWAPVGGENARSDFLLGTGVSGAIDFAHRHLTDAVIGIVGLGEIGTALAGRAQACGMRALAIDARRTERPESVEWLGKPEDLDRLLAESEYVVVCAPHTPQTKQMFGRAEFAKMRRDAFFINVGRGALVDLSELVGSLKEGLIAGAALDVYETEPLPAEHALWGMENVILTPHVAGYGPRIAERHLQVFLDNLRRFHQGEPLRNVVDKAAWF